MAIETTDIYSESLLPLTEACRLRHCNEVRAYSTYISNIILFSPCENISTFRYTYLLRDLCCGGSRLLGRCVFHCPREELTRSSGLVVEHPAVPVSLPVRVEAGVMIGVDGVVQAAAREFVIRLTQGAEVDADVAFQFKVILFPDNYVDRNSRVCGRWGQADEAMGQRMPFTASTPFHVDIIVTDIQYAVAVDGRHFVSFPHRLPLAGVTTLVVDGDVEVEAIKLGVWSRYPETCRARPKSYDAVIGREVDDVEVPFIGRLTESLEVGKEVVVVGRVHMLPSEFWIRLQHGRQWLPPPPVPLNIAVRYTPTGEQHIALNAFIDGVQGPDMAVTEHLFPPGASFTLVVAVTSEHYVITVDGNHVVRFKHRLPVDRGVDTVYIKGAVNVKSIAVRRTDEHTSVFQEWSMI